MVGMADGARVGSGGVSVGVADGVGLVVVVGKAVGAAVSVKVGTGVSVAVPTASCAFACVVGLPVVPHALMMIVNINSIIHPPAK